MNPADLIVIAVIAAILGGAAWYIYKSKKNGVHCIGCPDAKTCPSKGCSGKCSGCSGNCGRQN